MTIPITSGDPSLGPPFYTATWESGADTIEVKVYPIAGAETSAERRERILETMSAALDQYPPS